MLTLLAFAAPPPSIAAGSGDPYVRLRPLFQFEPPPRRAARPRTPRPAPVRKAAVPRNRAGSAKRAAVPASPPKASDAKLVLVAGDFFGQALAEGLSETFAGEASVRVESAARARAGLVRREPAALLPPAETQPAALVIMLGGNDRQAIQAENGRVPLNSPGWSTAYGAKVSALAEEAERRNVPLLWVGLPSVASGKAASDFLAFNELYRASAEAVDGVFVDSWDAFVNESGAFATFGPDVGGQRARLRTKDGVGFTRAGRRKLAFFVAKPLAKLLGLPPGSPSGVPGGVPLEGVLLRPGMTAPMPLGGFVLEEGADTELTGGPANAAPASGDGNSLLYDPPPVAGRADNFLGSAASSAGAR